MDLLHNLALGFSLSLTPLNILYCFIGAILGTITGVLPGLGATAAIALLLPITFRMNSTSALIMLSGIYYGAMYGGSITSVLVNIPGEPSSLVTCIDGYKMARKGRAGAALGMSAFGSFIGGTIVIVGMTLIAFPVANFALSFGPPEFTSLVILGLILTTYLSRKSMIKSLMMAVVGLLLACVGLDPILGAERFTFGSTTLSDGMNIAVMCMGFFGITEVLSMAEKSPEQADYLKQSTKLKDLLPTKQDWKDSSGPIARGTLLGFFLGLLPGGGAFLASIASYVTEKKLSKHPERFGTGVIEGVAGPETANNAGAQAAFVPLLTLGIPSNVVMAVIMGALMIQGITPGPLLYKEHPELFWGVMTSFYIGNVLLIILNVPLISVFVAILRVPYAILSPLIIIFCFIGAFSLNNNPMDVVIMSILGLIGYGMRKLDLDPAPLLLAFVLGGIVEKALRQSLLIGRGSPLIFVTRPISVVLLAVALGVLAIPVVRFFIGRRGRVRA
jgi:putative tricarboxylic transport membrane protein